ncbi:hypothetical protein HPULCUR_000673 [Helicostylum pulchrum]|uniref:Uncharacterized protein n=1 Tax=Helicostylum pulchrum TaxID=562976 RepID=A0ABP9XKI9_9FUNG
MALTPILFHPQDMTLHLKSLINRVKKGKSMDSITDGKSPSRNGLKDIISKVVWDAFDADDIVYYISDSDGSTNNDKDDDEDNEEEEEEEEEDENENENEN